MEFEKERGKDFFQSPERIDCDLTLCNSPFNTTDGTCRFPPHCPPITSIITLPHDAFEVVKVHSEILLFNMPRLRPHYFLPDDVLDGKLRGKEACHA